MRNKHMARRLDAVADWIRGGAFLMIGVLLVAAAFIAQCKAIGGTIWMP